MKISRIALASLISFGVLGGASLNASASHSHYQQIVWNKTMTHRKVALKNGRGIIWNKPYKTAKNAKIKYRINHKKGLVLTTVRHMKIKGGSIYYFVKGGKISGWINKNSVKLVKSKGDKTNTTVVQPTSSQPVAPATNPITATPNTPNKVTTEKASTPSTNSTNSTTSGASTTTQTNRSNIQNVTDKGNHRLKIQQDSSHAFDTSINATLSNTAWVYHQKWDNNKMVDSNIASRLKKGTKVEVALNDPHEGHEKVMIQTLDGHISGYVDWSELQLGNGSEAVTPVPEKSESTDQTAKQSDSGAKPASTNTSTTVPVTPNSTGTPSGDNKGTVK